MVGRKTARHFQCIFASESSQTRIDVDILGTDDS
jgi:hypothetical protein